MQRATLELLAMSANRVFTPLRREMIMSTEPTTLEMVKQCAITDIPVRSEVTMKTMMVIVSAIVLFSSVVVLRAAPSSCSSPIRVSIGRSAGHSTYQLDGRPSSKFPLGAVADKLSGCLSKRRLEITLNKDATDADFATAANAIQKLQAGNAHVFRQTEQGIKEIPLPPLSESPAQQE